MARPLRIEYAGAYYHVTNRGNQRQAVFKEPGDYELFLEPLGQFSDLFDVRVGISLSGLTVARDRVAESLRHDKTLMGVWRHIEQKLKTL